MKDICRNEKNISNTGDKALKPIYINKQPVKLDWRLCACKK